MSGLIVPHNSVFKVGRVINPSIIIALSPSENIKVEVPKKVAVNWPLEEGVVCSGIGWLSPTIGVLALSK